MPTSKTNSARRREVRRNRPDRGWAWLRVLRQREVGWAVLFVLLFTLVGGLIAMSAQMGPQHHVNQVVTDPVISRVSFEAINEEMTRREKAAAQAAVPVVYRPNYRYLEELREMLAGLLALADQKYPEIRPEIFDAVPLTAEGHAELVLFYLGTGAERSQEAWQRQTERLLRGFFDLPVLSQEQWEAAVEERAAVTVVKPLPNSGAESEGDVFYLQLKSVESLDDITERARQVTSVLPASLRGTVEKMLLANIQPTYFQDDTATVARQMAAYAAARTVYDSYRPGDLLVPSETRLTEEHARLLADEHTAFRTQQSNTQALIRRSATVGTLFLLAVAWWLYIFHSGSRVISNPTRGLAVTALLLLGQALAVICDGLWPAVPFGGVTFPTLMVTIVLAVVYTQPFALVLGVVHALVVTVTLGRPVGFALVLLAGVVIAVWQLREVRSRSKLVVVGATAGLAMAATAAVVLLADNPAQSLEQWRRLGIDAAAALGSGFAAGLIVQGMLPLIERAFRVTTAMTLKELNDNARPLLKRLSHEAPGTYQHSLRIADMAEAAAEAIGADGLLCRVGAMYHDVGKINKPQYFIENQGGGPNKHNKLSPAMSLLIIVGHVKDGIEMAREYALPRCLIHFIESHHGTTLVEYFYHAAKKQQEEKDHELGHEGEESAGPSEFEFRYPGPKPQAKEAAIMLICDGIEAAARACDEPTPARLRQITHSIAMKRLMDGQFDECSLTLAELSKIEKAIVKTLCAIYHSRIKYPAGETKPVAASA